MSFALIYNNRSIKEKRKNINERQNFEKKDKNIYKDYLVKVLPPKKVINYKYYTL